MHIYHAYTVPQQKVFRIKKCVTIGEIRNLTKIYDFLLQ